MHTTEEGVPRMKARADLMKQLLFWILVDTSAPPKKINPFPEQKLKRSETSTKGFKDDLGYRCSQNDYRINSFRA